MTDPVCADSSEVSKVNQYNRKVIEGFLLEYKKSFHNALLWVKLREKIVKFLRKECPKNSPGMIIFLAFSNFLFRFDWSDVEFRAQLDDN